jgi:hypothetical protein
MGRHAARDVQADRGDLALADPDAGERAPLARVRLDPLGRQRGDDRLLDRADEGGDVADPHDRVADELPGAVVGEAAAAVALDDVDALRAIPVLAHRQVAGAGAPAERVDGRVVEQQQHVGLLAGLHALAQ